MAASTISRRRNAQAEARAAKERKQKIFLGFAVGLLLLVLVFELPKIMKGSGSSTSSSTATPAVATPATSAPVAATKSDSQIKQDLREIRKLPPHDVFGRAAAVGAQPAFQNVDTPSGVRDPFEGTGTASANPVITKPKAPTASYASQLPAQIVIGTKTKNTVATKGWIVILASIPSAKGRTSATSFVSKAAAKGLTGLKVLNSSSSKSLRSGYWVVYSGPFTTIPQVNQHATSVHAAGYGSAYIRQLVVYHAK